MRFSCRIPPTLLVFATFAAAGCGLFETRTPEPPITEGGTYLQPDTPEQVVENLQNAIREANTLNYRRSMADDLEFHPTATAEARDAIWSGWSVTEEESYYSTLVAAITQGGSLSLALNDESITAIDAQQTVVDATYVLTADHNRPEIPRVLQGRLVWLIVQNSDGLWELRSWTDREVGTEPSWSDLKAAFAS